MSFSSVRKLYTPIYTYIYIYTKPSPEQYAGSSAEHFLPQRRTTPRCRIVSCSCRPDQRKGPYTRYAYLMHAYDVPRKGGYISPTSLSPVHPSPAQPALSSPSHPKPRHLANKERAGLRSKRRVGQPQATHPPPPSSDRLKSQAAPFCIPDHTDPDVIYGSCVTPIPSFNGGP